MQLNSSNSNAGCLQSLGTYSAMDVKLLASDPNAGITITLRNGDVCSGSPNGVNSSTVINLACDPTLNTPANDLDIVSLAGPTEDCEYVYTMRSAFGCPYSKVKVVPSLGAGWIAFLIVLLASAMYCIGGVAYNRYKFGASGLEALPHINLIRKGYATVTRTLGLARADESAGAEYFSVGADGEDAEEPPR